MPIKRPRIFGIPPTPKKLRTKTGLMTARWNVAYTFTAHSIVKQAWPKLLRHPGAHEAGYHDPALHLNQGAARPHDRACRRVTGASSSSATVVAFSGERPASVHQAPSSSSAKRGRRA